MRCTPSARRTARRRCRWKRFFRARRRTRVGPSTPPSRSPAIIHRRRPPGAKRFFAERPERIRDRPNRVRRNDAPGSGGRQQLWQSRDRHPSLRSVSLTIASAGPFRGPPHHLTLMIAPPGLRAWLPLLLVAGLLASRPAARAHEVSLKDVMARVGAYVDGYGQKASIVVATEPYKQERHGNTYAEHGKRDLVADFALVMVEAANTGMGFRDVIEVDGKHVQDREDRLARVLMASAGRFDEAMRLNTESARFNIGPFLRNFNIPTTALFFFNSENHRRFKFSAKSVVADGTWEIAFHETQEPTLIHTPDWRPVPTEGTIWANPADGTVVRTVLKVGGAGQTARPGTRLAGSVDVTCQRVDTLSMWLPATMDETFQTNGTTSEWELVKGHAVYSNYREFTTEVKIK